MHNAGSHEADRDNEQRTVKLPWFIGLAVLGSLVGSGILCTYGVSAQKLSVENHGTLGDGIHFVEGKSCQSTYWNFPSKNGWDDTFGGAKTHLSIECLTPLGRLSLVVEKNIDGSITAQSR